jgi:hypothetical protein
VATLTPAFPEFLPPWVARQPWYAETDVPALRQVGAFRFEDPDGEVGMETHLFTDGTEVYQVPMTYRGAPLAEGALIATAEHSELGPRWIYDAESDPVWRAELLRLVRDGGDGGPCGRGGTQEVRAHGVPLGPVPDGAAIELIRTPSAGGVAGEPGVLGAVMGTWCPAGTDPVTGCLAIVRDPATWASALAGVNCWAAPGCRSRSPTSRPGRR